MLSAYQKWSAYPLRALLLLFCSNRWLTPLLRLFLVPPGPLTINKQAMRLASVLSGIVDPHLQPYFLIGTAGAYESRAVGVDIGVHARVCPTLYALYRYLTKCNTSFSLKVALLYTPLYQNASKWSRMVRSCWGA